MLGLVNSTRGEGRGGEGDGFSLREGINLSYGWQDSRNSRYASRETTLSHPLGETDPQCLVSPRILCNRCRTPRSRTLTLNEDYRGNLGPLWSRINLLLYPDPHCFFYSSPNASNPTLSWLGSREFPSVLQSILFTIKS